MKTVMISGITGQDGGYLWVQEIPKYYRPAEVELLLGNSEKAQKVLNWKTKIDFKSLCRMMTEADIARIQA